MRKRKPQTYALRMQNLSNLLGTRLWLTLSDTQHVSSKIIMPVGDRHVYCNAISAIFEILKVNNFKTTNFDVLALELQNLGGR